MIRAVEFECLPDALFEKYELLGIEDGDLGCIEEHPEGSDRGGYVPTLTNGCYYMENDGEWRG